MTKMLKSFCALSLVAVGLLTGCGAADRNMDVNQFDARYNVNDANQNNINQDNRINRNFDRNVTNYDRNNFDYDNNRTGGQGRYNTTENGRVLDTGDNTLMDRR
jgi:hypothetical protein